MIEKVIAEKYYVDDEKGKFNPRKTPEIEIKDPKVLTEIKRIYGCRGEWWRPIGGFCPSYDTYYITVFDELGEKQPVMALQSSGILSLGSDEKGDYVFYGEGLWYLLESLDLFGRENTFPLGLEE